MLTRFRQLTAGVRKKERKAQRRLGVEPLESRTLLSVAGLGAPVFAADLSLADSLPGLADTDFAAKLAEAKQGLQAEAAGERASLGGQRYFSEADSPAVGPVPAMKSLAGLERPGVVSQPMPAAPSTSPRSPEGLSTARLTDHLASPVAIAALHIQPALVSTGSVDLLGHGSDMGVFASVAEGPPSFPITFGAAFSTSRADSDSVTSSSQTVRRGVPGATSTDMASGAAWSRWLASPAKADEAGTRLLGVQIRVLETWVYRETESEFVSIEFVRVEPNLRPVYDLPTLREHVVEAPPPAPANGLTALRDSTPPTGDGLRAPVPHQQASGLVGLTLDPLPISGEIRLPGASGFVGLPAYISALTADWQAGWASREGTGSVPPSAGQLTGTVSLFTATRNDASPAAAGPYDQTRPLTLDNATEGGFVDVGIVPDTLPSPPGHTRLISQGRSLWDSGEQDGLESVWKDAGDEEKKPLWNSEEQEVLDSIWTGFGKEYAPVQKNGVAGDDDPQPDEPSIANDASEGAAHGFGWASYGEEGGMIELAAVLPAADSPRASAGSSLSVGDEPSFGVREIQMDKGVGRFQAFELATVPTPYVDGSHMIRAEANEPVRAVLDTATTSTADAPAAEASASRKLSERLVHRAAALPTIVLFGSLATAVDAAFQEEASQFPTRRSRAS